MENDIVNWSSKLQAMPNIPNSKTKDGFIDSVKRILDTVHKKSNKNTLIQFDGSNSTRTLDELCLYLKPVGLIKKETINSNWVIDDSIGDWHDKNFKYNLAILFSKRIKYFSELLELLKVPKNKHQILEDASSYGLYWKEHSQIYSRLLFLRDFGFVIRIPYENNYIITEEGLKFLEKFPPINRELIHSINYDETEKELSFEIPDWCSELIDFNWDTEIRNISIAYIPGGSKTATTTIIDVLNECRNTCDDSILAQYIEKTFDVKGKFIGQLLTILTQSELLDRIGLRTYRTNELGLKVLESKTPEVAMLFAFHKSYYFIFEILMELFEQPRSVKELTSISVTKYHMEKESIDQIRKRLNFLKNAKLIINDKDKKFKLSNRGKNLVIEINNYIDLTNYKNEKKEINIDTKKDILKNLRIHSVDSTHPKKFEEIINEYFQLLGFHTNYYGASGTTDILLTTPTAPKFTFKVAIEVKTNWEGKITEKIINFDTLKEHKKKHGADYIVVIGKEFVGDRLIDRAESNNVLLMNVKTLEDLFKNHKKYPLQPVEYKPIFEQNGIADLTVLHEEHQIQERRRILFQLIIKVLIENSNDSYSKGLLSIDNIYFLIKMSGVFKEKPLEDDELINMLNLLSNPLIGCVGIDKASKKYYAKGSIDDAVLKFSIYNNTKF
ncbi:restriction endonuclease [Macrococcoides bohemicum]|uniref:restriction endonuclease n=1 Tax=Macrococcoides bohemicum TaxID=1903056 RepID=UPI00193FF50E|nr:restriction endonuclease [Macrococcus bohemicus]QRN49111.1 restriction endonuclease [Macrococcus bohemicus]